MDEQIISITVNGSLWYLRPYSDTTHFDKSHSLEGLKTGALATWHIGQHRDEGYYYDIRDWLKGISNPDGNEYTYKEIR